MLSAADADLVRRDPALPGLASLLDPEAFLHLLRCCLPDAEGPAQTDYIRYKPGTSCLIAYRLGVAGAETWVSGRAYPLGASDKLQKLRRGAADSRGRGPLVLADRALVLSFFPDDRRLRALAQLADEQTRQDVLKRLFTARPGLAQGTLSTLRYKPERRYVAQLAHAGVPEAVVKLYSRADYRGVYSGSKRLRSGSLLRVPRRLGSSDRYRAAAFEWLPGRLLGELVVQPALLPGEMERLGAAVAELHAQENRWAPLLAREEEARTLLERAAALARLCPTVAHGLEGLAMRMADRILQMPPRENAIHGDFHPKQVLLHGGTVGIVDLDAAARGDPAIDLGNFIAHLHREALRGGAVAERLAALADALCRGHGDPSVRERVGVQTAAGLLRLAPHAFRNREPDWPERIEATVKLAETVFDAESTAPRSRRRRSAPAYTGPTYVPVIDPYRVAQDRQWFARGHHHRQSPRQGPR